MPVAVSDKRARKIRRRLGLAEHADVRIAAPPPPGVDVDELECVNIYPALAFEVLSRFHAYCIATEGTDSKTITADELIAVFGGVPELAAPLDSETTAADINHYFAATGLASTHAAICDYACTLAAQASDDDGTLPAWDGVRRTFPAPQRLLREQQEDDAQSHPYVAQADGRADADASLTAREDGEHPVSIAAEERARVCLLLGLPADTRIADEVHEPGNTRWNYRPVALEAIARLWALHAWQGRGRVGARTTAPEHLTATAASHVLGGHPGMFTRSGTPKFVNRLITDDEECLRALDARRDALVAEANSEEHQQHLQSQTGIARFALPAWDGVLVIKAAPAAGNAREVAATARPVPARAERNGVQGTDDPPVPAPAQAAVAYPAPGTVSIAPMPDWADSSPRAYEASTEDAGETSSSYPPLSLRAAPVRSVPLWSPPAEQRIGPHCGEVPYPQPQLQQRQVHRDQAHLDRQVGQARFALSALDGELSVGAVTGGVAAHPSGTMSSSASQIPAPADAQPVDSNSGGGECGDGSDVGHRDKRQRLHV